MTSTPPQLLQALKTAVVGVLEQGTWRDIEASFKTVDLDWREDLEPGHGKPQYVYRVLNDLGDQDVLDLGRRCLDHFEEVRIQSVQDALWWIEAGGTSRLSKVTRFALADEFDGRALHPREPLPHFMAALCSGRVGGLGQYAYGDDGRLYSGGDPLFRADSSWEPTNHREMLVSYGFLDWPDRRLMRFLEGLVRPEVRQGDEQQEWVAFINEIIAKDGFELREADRVSGHPVFTIRMMIRGVPGRPKNLIFASNGPKPEIGFADAVNNDIVILSNAESCLIYEEPLTDDGLLWEDLVSWWSRRSERDLSNEEARKELGHRLQVAVEATGSPPEKHLFGEYFRSLRPVYGATLPALIPQVYLHYDPMTLKRLRATGREKRFPAQRMDFLLLLPNRVRVVLEVDGKQHYSDARGPSPRKYAETVQADRQLRLLGYEVYRFSGYELRTQEAARATIEPFFQQLFQRRGVRPANPAKTATSPSRPNPACEGVGDPG